MSPLALSIRFLQTQPDSRLVELARAGHERAFEALVHRYRRQLLAYARRLAASDAGAEDALQQALLQAWIALGSADTEVRDARAWLYRIVHNVAVSNLRRPTNNSVTDGKTEEASGADDEVEQRIALRQALAGLASLPDLQRRVMMSTALEGLSHDEIAVALGLSHGAVRGLIYRARATLRAAAAVLVPSPVVNWVARQDISGGRSTALYEVIAGSGSAGLGSVLIKGGALVVTAGALATAAGVTSSHGTHRSHHPSLSAAALRQSGGGAAGAPHAALASTGSLPVSSLTVASGGAPSAASGGGRAAVGTSVWRTGGNRHRRGRDGSPSGGDGSHRGPGGGGPSGTATGGDHSGGTDGGSQTGSGGGQSGGDHGGGKQLSAGTSGGTSQSGSGAQGDGSSGGDNGGSGGDHGGSGGDNGGATTATAASTSTTATSTAPTTSTSSVATVTTPQSGDGSSGGGHGD